MSPYPGVPDSKTEAMEKCVAKVMKTGKSKSSAIAICHDSIMGKAREVPMTHRKPGKRERAQMKNAELRAAEVKANDEEIEPPDIEEEGVPAGVEAKDMDAPMAYLSYEGAASFAEFDAWREGVDKANQAYELTGIFRSLVDNILTRDDIENKGEAIAAAAREFETRIKKEPDAKEAKSGLAGVIDKIIGAFTPKPEKLAESQKDSSFLVYKETGGGYRWVGRVTNKWRDRDAAANPKNGGEIITEAAHKEFMAYLDANPDAAPELWAWHTPGTAFGKADFWDYADGFVIMSGPLTEPQAKSLQAGNYMLGMSHGFGALPAWRDKEHGLINKYRTIEVSHLPLVVAANIWTDFETIRKEVAMFSEDKRKYLVDKLGEAEVKRIEGDSQLMAKTLEAIGVESKGKGCGCGKKDCAECTPPVVAKEEPKPEVPATEEPKTEAKPPEAPPPAEPAKAIDVSAILKELDIPALNAYLQALVDKQAAQDAEIVTLKAQIAETKKSTDEKLAEQIFPAVGAVLPIWKQRPSQSKETEITTEDAAALGAPKASWVSDAIKPVQQ